MSAPEASDTAFDTLIIEPVPPIAGTQAGESARPDSLSVITIDPETGARTETTLESVRRAPEPASAVLDVRKRFTELDGLRGAAALLVVIFHLRKYIRDLDPPRSLDLLISGGYVMVDLFFVLSGFVLARSMLSTRTPGDVLKFSSMRARRFLPLHLTGVAIVFGCALVTWLTQHYGFQNAPNRPAFSLEQETPWGYLSAVLLLQGLFGPHFAGYAAAWSLSVELWTNILLVIAIAAVPWAHRKQWVGPIAVAAGTLILFTLGKEGENSIGWTAFGRGLTGLGAGMVIYWLYTAAARRGIGSVTGSHRLAGSDGPEGLVVEPNRRPGGYRPARWPAIGAVLGLLALLACMYYSKDLRHLQFLPVLTIAAVLIFCLVQPSDGPAHRLMNSRVVQWLGSRSFALYALHGSTLIAITLACRLRGLHLHEPKVAIFIIVTTLIGSLVTAEIGHRFIERLWVPKKSE
jgi:peptidoglycan/LPS O-acetylase OafA/YrhL